MTDEEEPGVPEDFVAIPREQARRIVGDTVDMQRQAAGWLAALISGIPALRVVTGGDHTPEHLIQIRELIQIAAGALDEPDPEELARLEGGTLAWKLVHMWGRAAELDIGRDDDLSAAIDRIEPALHARFVRYGGEPLTSPELEELADLVVAAAEQAQGIRWITLTHLAARLGALAQAGAPLIPFPLSELALIEAGDVGAVIKARVRAALADQ